MKKEESTEIEKQMHQKKFIIVVMVSIILVAFASLFFHSKPQEKLPEKSVEETYTPQVQETVEAKPAVLAAKESDKETKQNPPVTQEMMQAQILLFQEKQKELQQRLSAPLMVVNNKSDSKAVDAAQHETTPSTDPNTRFLNQVASQTTNTVNATKLGPLNSIIAEGSLIHAVLESATDSDLPGYLRAEVSETNFSEDGLQVLIPVGSRLIGQYKSGMLQGQSRIFIVWTRLITPDGTSVDLGSPGIDSLGVAGIGADEVNRHFWQRFGTASLLSLLGAGASNAGVSGSDQNNSAAEYRAAVASSFAQSANESLQQESNIAPTLKTYQGKPVMVFVARDIHFENVAKSAGFRMNIF
jgi:type IV secretion system protein VirB10